MSEWSKLEQEDRRVAQKMQQLYYWDFRLFGYTKPWKSSYCLQNKETLKTNYVEQSYRLKD